MSAEVTALVIFSRTRLPAARTPTLLLRAQGRVGGYPGNRSFAAGDITPEGLE